MSNIANTIYQAIVAHTAWKKRLREIIDTGKNEYDVSSEHCDFGKLLNEKVGELSVYEQYSTIVALHRKFHDEAAIIIKLATSGQQKEANAAIEYGKEFDATSQSLVKTLIAWHDVVIAK